MVDLEGLPGAERVEAGLRDLTTGATTPNALLVSIASRRLSWLGIDVPEPSVTPSGSREAPELTLYRLLCASSDDPYYRHGALLRELDSFLDALDLRLRNEKADPNPAREPIPIAAKER